MNDISVPKSTDTDSTNPVPDAILEELTQQFNSLTPELRKAATYVLENPQDVGVSSIREIADAANVKPNTFVRMAREIGFDGYDDFRLPFREHIKKGVPDFPDRARWLQSIRQGGKLGDLYADMVAAMLSNIEATFAGIEEKQLKDAAETIWAARRVFTLGVGVNSANAQNFTYLASTGMVEFYSIPKVGSVATDDLAWADGQDVLIAITCKPYRSEVLDAIRIAKEQGVKIIGISDSPASPVITNADFGFVVAAETPQFFPSSVSTIAFLETLLSFVIASATPEVVDRVDLFHKRRHELGIYKETLE